MQTPRLELVKLTSDHAPDYFTIWSDPFTTRWSSHGPCTTLDSAIEWMSGLLPDKNPQGENYAILLRSNLDPATLPKPKPDSNNTNPTHTGNDTTEREKDSNFLQPGHLIGVIGTHKSTPVPEMGMIFHRSTWGMGFATEALTAFLELFWKVRPEFDVVEAYCDTENGGSINVLRKSGFEVVETTYGDYVLPWMRPERRDTIRWRAVRPKIQN